jgi:hypothetical protein
MAKLTKANTQMTTLIYKRTHSGDPDPETGVFGNNKCMGRIRGWKYDAVIGIGGIGSEAERNGLKGKLTWIGVGARKTGDTQKPFVTFDHFRYYGTAGPFLRTLAPALAIRMYDKNVRATTDWSFTAEERNEVQSILKMAAAACPSSARSSSKSSPESQKTCCK